MGREEKKRDRKGEREEKERVCERKRWMERGIERRGRQREKEMDRSERKGEKEGWRSWGGEIKAWALTVINNTPHFKMLLLLAGKVFAGNHPCRVL